MPYVPQYLLRWRFEWKDRPAKYGMWSHSGMKEDLTTKAWCNNGESLLFAIVEAKNFVTREIKPVVVCSGQDFRNFQWLALASVPGAVRGKTVPITRVGGHCPPDPKRGDHGPRLREGHQGAVHCAQH